MKFTVIGITDHPQPFFPPEVMEVIRAGQVFAGGRRHHELVASLLPDGAEWIDITVPIDGVFAQFRKHDTDIIVFASGDPLFFGFANTIRRHMPETAIQLYPTFNSLQILAHRLVIPYHDMRVVSLTGRPWTALDEALIEGAGKIGVLTDHEHTPTAIARRLLDYGYTDYTLSVGEHLGNPMLERVTTLTLPEASEAICSSPNCVLLVSAHPRRPRFGLPDAEFALLDGRTKMITKMPVRLLTLQALDLPQKHVFWDIGFCTGSVSIEARLQFPHLHVVAFERRPECAELMHVNSRRFGTPGIQTVIADFLTADLTPLPRPDAVFIGGHGGRLKDIIRRVLDALSTDGCIVMNSVTAPKVQIDSHALFDEACHDFGLWQELPTRIILNNHHPIEILKCKRQPSSPSARKADQQAACSRSN